MDKKLAKLEKKLKRARGVDDKDVKAKRREEEHERQEKKRIRNELLEHHKKEKEARLLRGGSLEFTGSGAREEVLSKLSEQTVGLQSVTAFAERKEALEKEAQAKEEALAKEKQQQEQKILRAKIKSKDLEKQAQKLSFSCLDDADADA
eukprot:tig00000388_g24796.t1